MTDPHLSSIALPDLGALDISIPICTFGAGRPVLTLVTGVHGDETAGIFVLDALLRELGDFRGQLRIVPSANPVAQAMDMRASPRDNLDLNRIFPGEAEGQLPERIAAALMRLFADSDLLVDFHSFGLRNPVMAIQARCGSLAVRRRSLEAIRIFGPEMIWVLDVATQGDVKYRGALAPALLELDVPNFAVEMPINYRLDEDHVRTAVAGLRRLMAWLGMLDEDPAPPVPAPPMYRRQAFHAPSSGLFYPLCEIMMPVDEGQLIGEIASIRDFRRRPIRAPRTGFLLQIHDRAFVVSGTAIFAMGEAVDDEC